MGVDVGENVGELVEGVGCVGIEGDVFVDVEFGELLEVVDEDGFGLGVGEEWEELGMGVFGVNKNVCVFVVGGGVVVVVDCFLEGEE